MILFCLFWSRSMLNLFIIPSNSFRLTLPSFKCLRPPYLDMLIIFFFTILSNSALKLDFKIARTANQLKHASANQLGQVPSLQKYLCFLSSLMTLVMIVCPYLDANTLDSVLFVSQNQLCYSQPSSRYGLMSSALNRSVRSGLGCELWQFMNRIRSKSMFFRSTCRLSTYYSTFFWYLGPCSLMLASTSLLFYFSRSMFLAMRLAHCSEFTQSLVCLITLLNSPVTASRCASSMRAAWPPVLPCICTILMLALSLWNMCWHAANLGRSSSTSIPVYSISYFWVFYRTVSRESLSATLLMPTLGIKNVFPSDYCVCILIDFPVAGLFAQIFLTLGCKFSTPEGKRAILRLIQQLERLMWLSSGSTSVATVLALGLRMAIWDECRFSRRLSLRKGLCMRGCQYQIE